AGAVDCRADGADEEVGTGDRSEPRFKRRVSVDMEIELSRCTLRPFRNGDEADIVRQANNPNVARHLRDRFPQPYNWEDAEKWIEHAAKQSPALNFAICVEGL